MNLFVPYPKYKKSDIDWLGDLPIHWNIRRLKSVINNAINGVWGEDPKNDSNDLICVRVADYDYKKLGISRDKLTIRNIASSFHPTRVLRENDLLIEKSGGGDIWSVGRVVNYDLDEKSVNSNFIARLVPSNEIHSRFLCYVFAAMYAVRLNERSIKQTTGIQNLDLYSYLTEVFSLPPLPEQISIANFLDRETAQINALIEKKRELINLLDKRRTSIISHAVTKGLNPKARMKASGIKWLGDVPKHWDVNLAKRFFKIDLGKMLDTNKQKNEIGEIKHYLRAANIHWDGVWIEDVKEMKFSKSQLKRYRLEKGDLLVTEGGATVGRSAIWHGELEECYYQNSINRARSKGNLPVEFLYYWLYFLKTNGYIDIAAEKATFGHLTKEKLEVIPTVCPPTDEANEIIRYLTDEVKYISEVSSQIEESIRLLEKQRTVLISAAVTGQIDVREQRK